MSNSNLVNYTKISPYKTTGRNHAIDTITIHCMAGNLSVETCGNVFQTAKASANYGIDSDGRVGMYVEEKDRSWASSSSSNDNRAVTIEVANDGGASTGWHVSAKAYKSLIALLVDICKRNGIKELKWKGDKSLIGQVDKQNMTVHRWFANKACPGDYLYNLHGQIAKEVNSQLITIKYRVHQQTYGWSEWKTEGQQAGTTGQAKRIEAIQIDPCGKKISIKAHIQGIGWKDYGVINKNTVIGTTGQGKRIEAIEIHGAKVCCHMQTIGWASDYMNLQGTLGIGKRMEAIKIKAE